MKRLKAFSRNRSTSSKYKENHAIDPDLEEFQWAGKKVNWKENIHPRDRKKIESPVARRKQGDRVKPHVVDLDAAPQAAGDSLPPLLTPITPIFASHQEIPCASHDKGFHPVMIATSYVTSVPIVSCPTADWLKDDPKRLSGASSVRLAEPTSNRTEAPSHPDHVFVPKSVYPGVVDNHMNSDQNSRLLCSDQDRARSQHHQARERYESLLADDFSVVHYCHDCGKARSNSFHKEHPVQPGKTPRISCCKRCIQRRLAGVPPPRSSNSLRDERYRQHFCSNCGCVRSVVYHQSHPVPKGKLPTRNYCSRCKSRVEKESKRASKWYAQRNFFEAGHEGTNDSLDKINGRNGFDTAFLYAHDSHPKLASRHWPVSTGPADNGARSNPIRPESKTLLRKPNYRRLPVDVFSDDSLDGPATRKKSCSSYRTHVTAKNFAQFEDIDSNNKDSGSEDLWPSQAGEKFKRCASSKKLGRDEPATLRDRHRVPPKSKGPEMEADCVPAPPNSEPEGMSCPSAPVTFPPSKPENTRGMPFAGEKYAELVHKNGILQPTEEIKSPSVEQPGANRSISSGGIPADASFIQTAPAGCSAPRQHDQTSCSVSATSLISGCCHFSCSHTTVCRHCHHMHNHHGCCCVRPNEDSKDNSDVPATASNRRSRADSILSSRSQSSSQSKRVQFASPEVSSSSEALDDYDRSAVQPNFERRDDEEEEYQGLDSPRRRRNTRPSSGASDMHFDTTKFNIGTTHEPETSRDSPFDEPNRPIPNVLPTPMLTPEEISQLFNDNLTKWGHSKSQDPTFGPNSTRSNFRRARCDNEADEVVFAFSSQRRSSNYVGHNDADLVSGLFDSASPQRSGCPISKDFSDLYGSDLKTSHNRSRSAPEFHPERKAAWYMNAEEARLRAESEARLMAAATVSEAAVENHVPPAKADQDNLNARSPQTSSLKDNFTWTHSYQKTEHCYDYHDASDLDSHHANYSGLEKFPGPYSELDSPNRGEEPSSLEKREIYEVTSDEEREIEARRLTSLVGSPSTESTQRTNSPFPSTVASGSSGNKPRTPVKKQYNIRGSFKGTKQTKGERCVEIKDVPGYCLASREKDISPLHTFHEF